MERAILGVLWLALFPLALFPQSKPNAECLACHGQQEMRSESGRSIYVDPSKYQPSVHGSLDCLTCHPAAKDFPHPKNMPQPDCASCHTQPAEELPKSVHGAARTGGDRDGPTCRSCHGSTHAILPMHDPASRVAKKNLAATCGACHSNPEFLARHKIPFARPVEAYRQSVHGRAVERGNQAAPSCSDCHASHSIFAARDSRSKINHWNVPETCGACHAEIKRTYLASIHGQAVQRGVPGAPVCTDCHGEHAILAPSEPQSLVNPARVSTVTCGRCHADERLAQRYNLPLDKVPAFEDSYHGLALRAGSQTVANCASCHGVHNIQPSSDARSTVHTAKLASTCGACHPGAGRRFAIGPVHVRPATVTEHAVVKWIRIAYLVLIPFTVAFMFFHNAADFFAKLTRGSSARARSDEEVVRMGLHFRIEHWLIVLSFPVLVVTGFALKFPESWWAAPILRWESQLAFRGTAHRIAGVVLIAAIVYHLIHLAVSRRDRIILRLLRPGRQDLADLWFRFRHNLGLSAEGPRFGKFSYAEKLEYWAFVWGTLVMAFSGFLLWFNNFTLGHFPKWVADAATAIHYYEAILATLAILIWHFYMVVFDPDVYPMDRAWLTGKTSADHLRHTRPAYYLQLVGQQQAQVTLSDEAAPTEDTAAPETQLEAKEKAGAEKASRSG